MCINSNNGSKSITRGDIIWTDFGKTRGSVQSALRPAVCVSNEKFNRYSSCLNVVPLSSRIKKASLPVHCIIMSSPLPSIALCEQATTISKEQVYSILGSVTADEMREIDECIKVQFALA